MKKTANKDQTSEPEVVVHKNPIVQMIEDKKRIIKAIENGESLDTLKGIKIVSPI